MHNLESLSREATRRISAGANPSCAKKKAEEFAEEQKKKLRSLLLSFSGKGSGAAFVILFGYLDVAISASVCLAAPPLCLSPPLQPVPPPPTPHCPSNCQLRSSYPLPTLWSLEL